MEGKRPARTVENFILAHAVGVPVATEPDHDEALFFREDGLIDVPAGDEMGKDDGTHRVCVCRVADLCS